MTTDTSKHSDPTTVTPMPADPFADLFGSPETAPGDSFHLRPIPGTDETPQPAAATAAPTAPAPSTPVETPPPADVKEPLTDVQVVSCDDLPSMLPTAGAWFVYDLETVPDETRFPRPETKMPTDRPHSGTSLDAVLSKPINSIKPILERLSLQELAELTALEQSGKNRATLVSAIADETAKLTGCDDSELQEWKRLGFAPFGLRIVSCGIATRDRVYVILCKTIAEEIKLLNHLWAMIDKHNHRIGYNIKGFDDAVIVARSMVLQLPVSEVVTCGLLLCGGIVMDRGRYAKEAIDLMAILFPTGTPMKLKTLCQQLGIVPPAGYEMSGDQVLHLVDADRWEDLALYSHSDAVIERELWDRVRNYVLI